MIDILYKWNRWGSNSLNSGIQRQMTAGTPPYVYTEEIIVPLGSRRSGKSTIFCTKLWIF